jgi:hypothetical protein
MPGGAADASVTQPGSVMDRSQVIDFFVGTPRLSSATWLAPPSAQSAESQMMRPAAITTTWNLAGLVSKEQVPEPVETA